MRSDKIEKKVKLPAKLTKKLGGARPGAGRKPGVKDLKTLKRMETLAEIKKYIASIAPRLIETQAALAFGVTALYHVFFEGDEKKRKKVVERVTDQNTVVSFLKGELTQEDGYFYMSTKDPDVRAIDSLLDRSFGKATTPLALDPNSEPLQKVEVTIINTPQKK